MTELPSPLNVREAKRVWRFANGMPAGDQRIGLVNEPWMNNDWKQILAKLGSGLAHEIRNPLHALRINLHVLRRAFGGHSTLSEEQLVATIRESNAAIDRLDLLMRDLLQLSDSSPGDASELNIVQEVQSALELLAENLKRDQISVRRIPEGLTCECHGALRNAILTDRKYWPKKTRKELALLLDQFESRAV